VLSNISLAKPKVNPSNFRDYETTTVLLQFLADVFSLLSKMLEVKTKWKEIG